MTTATPASQPSSINLLLDQYEKIDCLINSHNYRNPAELTAAASAIRWMYGQDQLDNTPSYAVLCRNLQHRPANVCREYFAFRADKWTVENIADLTERIGEPVMALVLAARAPDTL